MPFFLLLILILIFVSFLETHGILFLATKLRWSAIPVTSLVFLSLWGLLTVVRSNVEAWKQLEFPFLIVSSGVIVGIIIDYSKGGRTSNRKGDSDSQTDFVSSLTISILVAIANF